MCLKTFFLAEEGHQGILYFICISQEFASVSIILFFQAYYQSVALIWYTFFIFYYIQIFLFTCTKFAIEKHPFKE